MFKRVNKITALLVAAAAMLSIAPTTVASASTRLGLKDGTIEGAVAFKDGKYLYEGYRTSDNNTSIYYNDGSKDKELTDISDANLYGGNETQYGKYADKNFIVFDGNDEYSVDLSTGKVSDTDLASDDLSTTTVSLQSKLKKTSRYGNSLKLKDTDLTPVIQNQFGDVWYQYKVTTSDNGSKVASYGFVNGKGTYIDAAKTANIKVYNGRKMVKIDNFGDTTDGITANLASTPVVLGQDTDYIYVLTTVKFTPENVSVYDSKGTALSSGNQGTYIQKISKAQGDTEGDAYLPKTVAAYEVSTVDGDANTQLGVVKAQSVTSTKDYVGTRVVDGNVYVTVMDKETKVHTYKLKLVKDKFDATVNGTKQKVDSYAVEKDADKSQDVMEGYKAVSIDANGTVWAINKGSILKSEKAGDFTTVYTCDRALDSLDVYDENNLVAWLNGGDVYTTVGEGKAQTSTDAGATTTPTTPAKTGWVQANDAWTFYDSLGVQVKSKWVNANGAWYMLKADGNMATGWYNDNGTWYYLKSSGAMATGWLNDAGTWYYLNASGAMLSNTTVDGYVLGANGAWVK